MSWRRFIHSGFLVKWRPATPAAVLNSRETPPKVTSVLVPWNTCGAYISGVLGVSTASYFPYCFFNLLSSVLDVVYGFVGFKVPRADDGVVEPRPQGPETPTAPTVPA